MTPDASRPASLARLFDLAGVAMAALALFLVPLRALQHGWLPPDDARRHAAFAADDRTWDQVVLLREDARTDQHAAWHALLRAVQRASDASPQALVVACVLLLGAAFLLAPPWWLRRPEAWAAAVGAVAAADASFAPRVLSGRPLVVAMTVTAVVLMAWREPPARLSPGRLALTATGLGLAATLHGSWYLLAILPAAFAAARRWRDAGALAACWLAGTVAGALATGDPVERLRSPLHHAALALGSPAPWRVSEFAPSGGVPAAVALVAVALVARRLARLEAPPPWGDPALLAAALGWLIGLQVGRGWLDWGAPALAAWFAMEIERHLVARATAPARRVAAAAAAASLVLATAGADRGGRYSSTANETRLRADLPGIEEALPRPGGILYNQAMADFYSTYMEHPRGPWRHALGFEPALMPEDLLAEYRRMQESGYRIDTFEPWIDRMTPADRLLLRWDGPEPPPLHRLRWRRVDGDLWVGLSPP